MKDRCGGVCVDGDYDCQCGNSTFNIWTEEKFCCLPAAKQCTIKDTRGGVLLSSKVKVKVECSEATTMDLSQESFQIS